ncbi:condensation domain-containing protein, partial [Fulvivirga kasyanovii]
MRNQEIQDIYKLSPMQQGMLFHWLYDNHSPAYFVQNVYTIKGKIDLQCFEECLNSLSQKYDALRTSFVHEDLKEPLQVVLKSRKIEFLFIEANAYTEVEYLRVKDVERGFDLTNDSLMRVILIKTGIDGYKMIWSFHHIIMDGWSLAIIIKEFVTMYSGETLQASRVEPLQYKSFIKWIETRDRKESIDFWSKYLENCEESIDLPKSKLYPSKKVIKKKKYQLTSTLSNKLRKIASIHGLTLNSILQSVWKILMSRYNNTDNIVFGCVVSGRPYELEGIEDAAGLFVNTLPICTKLDSEERVLDLIRRVVSNFNLIDKHNFLPLNEIQSLSELKQNLVNQLWVFENHPRENHKRITTDKAGTKSLGFKITDVRSIEQTNFDLTITVFPDEIISIEFAYNNGQYATKTIHGVFEHFVAFADQIAENIMVKVSELTLLSDIDRVSLLDSFNSTSLDYDREENLL